jgi:hypothetical protein
MEHWFGEQRAKGHYVIGSELNQAVRWYSEPVAHQLDLQHQK